MRAVGIQHLEKFRSKRLIVCGRAANYLSVGQLYLYDNPLLKKPLELAHIKPRLVGY